MPVNPGAHVHSYESSFDVHSAPFLHGPEAQWSSSSQLGPANDEKALKYINYAYIYIYISIYLLKNRIGHGNATSCIITISNINRMS